MLNKLNNEYKQQLLVDFNDRLNYDQGKFYTPVGNKLVSLAKLENGQKVLDVATGTGIVAIAAANSVGVTGKVIGVDVSTGMLNQAIQKLAALGLQNVEFIEADVENLNFEENSFDRILCSLAICYLTDISAALQQWYRWLKPGGFLVFNAWAEAAFTPSVLFREVAQRYDIVIPNPNQLLGTVERCRIFLQEVGFKDIEVKIEQFGWYFTPNANNAEEMWRINAKNVFGYQVLQLSSEKLVQCKSEYIREIQSLPTTQEGAWCDAPSTFLC